MSTLRIQGLRVSVAGKQILNGIDLELFADRASSAKS